MATFGSIEQFDGTKEDWTQYEERLGHFFVANSITTADQKRAVFLSVVGPVTYRLLRSLVSPTKPGDKSYKDLVAALRKHFNPAPSEIVERCKFHSRLRKPGESVATFVAELRCLSEYCNFGTTLEAMLRDRLVCGINDDTLQKRLLSEPSLTYTRAVEIAQSYESATQNVKELKTKKEVRGGFSVSENEPVNKVATKPSSGGDRRCYRCGSPNHLAPECRLSKEIVCHKCRKRGHIQKACGLKKSSATKRSHVASSSNSNSGRFSKSVRRVGEQCSDSDSDQDEPAICHVQSSSVKNNSPPIQVELQLDDCVVAMEVDTGASVSLISEATFRQLWPGRSLTTSEVKLCSYSKEPIPVVGCCSVNIEYKGQTAADMPLLVVQGHGPSLLGRNWLHHVRLDWREIHTVFSESLQMILERHSSVFQDGLGKIHGFEATIHMDPNAAPRFYRARSVPYALRSMVDEELQRLVDEGTLEPVENSEWAAPIVPVLKQDKKSIRICGDFRLTVNPVSKLDQYPIPKVEDLFSRLEGGKYFTKLDLSQAYQQLPLDKESKKFTVINTHKGLFQYTRLPFGIASAPGIFQRVMENLLQGIPGVVVYIDDILIARKSEEEHLEALEEVLSRLERAGLRLKRRKCEFMKSSVSYLGHRIDAQGLHPLNDKVQAVCNAPAPQSVKELKSYLGLLSYYSKFLPNLSTVLHPLYHLLRKDTCWKWGAKEEEAFNKSKELLTSSSFLAHYDPTLSLSLACDASAYGVGAVLSHKLPDGSERPIGYASRTLNAAEQNYSQLEKEGLSCVFGIKRFHDYLFGRSFELITDHKPLLGLLKENRAAPVQASARIKRWSLFLSGYEYTLTFRNTTAHANADALSRLPLPVEPATSAPPPELVLLAEHLADSPVTADHIRSWTSHDPTLSKVLQYIQYGWPKNCDPDLVPFHSKKLELSAYDGCILWGNRVVIPKPGREAVLQELHESHHGITKMKALARMFVWWPGMDADIEESVRLCSSCQEVRSVPPPAPLHPWKWPSRPWSRLHLDFMGPFLGKTFLILIDAHSKWVEAMVVPSTSSQSVIEELRTLFAKFGLPETIVTDNGSGFVSQEFKSFLRVNGIKHITSAPYHPASNGLAERAVQLVKQGLKKVTDGTLNTRLAKILLSYRITPHSTTGVPPCQLMFNRSLRSRLNLLQPNIAQRVEGKQLNQKKTHDRSSRVREFKIGDSVFVKSTSGSPNWLPGTVAQVSGPVSFVVRFEDGRERRCHVDQIRVRFCEASVTEPQVEAEFVFPTPVTDHVADTRSDSEGPVILQEDDTSLGERSAIVHAYPKRVRNPPTRFEPGLTK